MEHRGRLPARSEIARVDGGAAPVLALVRGRGPRARRDAQALVELGLLVPILLLMGLATIDFGRGYFAGVAVMQGAREAARFAASSTGTSPPTETQAKQRAVDSASSDSPIESATAVGAVLSINDVSITIRDSNGTTTTYASRASGHSVQAVVTGFMPFYTGFLAEGVDGFAPGLNLCIGSGSSRRCGLTVTGEAYMIVL